MKWAFIFAHMVVLAGCLAEGDLPETDAGVVQWPDTSVPDVATTQDLGFDTGFEFGRVCDALAQDCEQGKCVPNASTGQSTCLQLGTQLPAGSACETITECAKGTHCATLPDDGMSLCRQMCEPLAEPDSCPTDFACIATLSSDSSVGLCVGPPASCDIYVNDCSTGDCVVRRDPISGSIGTYCGQAGTRRSGETCGGAAGDCEVGNVCVQLANQSSSTCQPVCRRPEDGPLRACPQTLTCTGSAASSGVTFCQ